LRLPNPLPYAFILKMLTAMFAETLKKHSGFEAAHPWKAKLFFAVKHRFQRNIFLYFVR
jgi:hypothetical protein